MMPIRKSQTIVGKISSCRWRHLVTKYVTNASSAKFATDKVNSNYGVNSWVRCASGFTCIWSSYYHVTIILKSTDCCNSWIHLWVSRYAVLTAATCAPALGNKAERSCHSPQQRHTQAAGCIRWRNSTPPSATPRSSSLLRQGVDEGVRPLLFGFLPAAARGTLSVSVHSDLGFFLLRERYACEAITSVTRPNLWKPMLVLRKNKRHAEFPGSCDHIPTVYTCAHLSFSFNANALSMTHHILF